MALRDAVAAIVEHWLTVLAVLDERDQAALVAALDEVRTDPDDTGAMLRAVAAVADRLPDGHPVFDALEAETSLWSAGLSHRQRLQNALSARLDALYLEWSEGSGAAPRDAFLLAAPALSAQEVAANGYDPAASALIRLVGADGVIRLPAFQFDSDGRPREVVSIVNELLDADHDPWGVADWWLGRHPWFDGAPADLVGRPGDASLVDIVRIQLDED